ncbi:MAG: fluoride efflux transporter CrcB [Granulosicoccus sp.]
MNLAVNFALVGLGGALGACCRYSMSLLLADPVKSVPLATLSVNVLGALIAGFVVTILFSRGLIPGALQLFIVVGFLGGFTTFSAFSVESLRLLQTGSISIAMANIFLNVIGSLLAVMLGAFTAAKFMAD